MRSGSPIDDAKCIASYVQVCQKIYKEHKDTCNKVSLLYFNPDMIQSFAKGGQKYLQLKRGAEASGNEKGKSMKEPQ